MSTKENNSPPFVLKANVVVRITKSDILLYPMLEQDSTPAERAYAFHINKNAIEAIAADACSKIDIMCTQLNQDAFADGKKNEWIRHYEVTWLNVSTLSITSFHNITGAVVNNATTATDSKVVLPVIVGAVADCHPDGVQFVHLQLELDFTTLAPDFFGSKIIKVISYIDLL